MRKKWKFGLNQRRYLNAYICISPFIVGFIAFFLYPLVQSIIFSLNDLEIKPDGFILHYVGLKNYHYALFVHPSFIRNFVATIQRMLVDVPLIQAFSLFMAVLLNQKFRGRTFVRVVFFLPVIMGAGVILTLERTDYMMGILGGGDTEASLFSIDNLRIMFGQFMLPQGLLDYVLSAVNRIADIIKASGIQILLFLAGLQSVPLSLYEAAEVEGSTSWESFWLITFPLLTPVFLTAIVYGVVDSFTSVLNPLVVMIKNTAFVGGGYGVSTAMASLYFMAILVLLLILIGAMSRRVFYHE